MTMGMNLLKALEWASGQADSQCSRRWTGMVQTKLEEDMGKVSGAQRPNSRLVYRALAVVVRRQAWMELVDFQCTEETETSS